MQVWSRTLAVIAALILVTFPALAQKFPPAVQASLNAVRKHVGEKGAKDGFEVLWKGDEAVRTTFPAHHLIIVRFRQFPIARVLPEGLQASNLFAVTKDGKIEYVKDAKALEKFFQTHLKAIKTEADAKTTLAAWLALTQEYRQDGFFKFEVLEKEFTADTTKASGRFVVMQGGNGDFKADLTFDKDGKLAKAEDKTAIRPGPRPICQATKLLDADPIVRRIAEEDLLIMGVSAHSYLMEQRERATPELRGAIDRLWKQIEKNGW